MLLFANILMAVVAFLAVVRIACGAPTRGDMMATLVKRDSIYEDCDKEQRAKAGQAPADAAKLARWVGDRQYKGRDFQQTNAYAYCSLM